VSAIFTLVSKEVKLELRRKAMLSGIGLYLVSLVFICYLTFSLRHNSISEATWSALFWLSILFSVINSVAKSFIGERKGLSIYYYTIAGPHEIILSKILYNTLLCTLLSLAGYGLFVVLIGNVVVDNLVFLSTLFLTSWGLASSLSLISGIASKANNSHVLMAVLSFPVVIAILLLAIKATKNAIDGLDLSVSIDELVNLGAINCIMTALAYLLFPYIWRS
jgi:heme exporter protein B